MMNRGTVMILLAFAGFGVTEPGYGAGPEPVPEVRPGILQGYLSPDAYPDSLALLPPPPAEGTAAHEADEALNRRLLTLMESSRFELEIRPEPTNIVGEARTHLDKLLSREPLQQLFRIAHFTHSQDPCMIPGGQLDQCRGINLSFLERGPGFRIETHDSVVTDLPVSLMK